ncbi:hypothetical protein [Saccharopolyspora sp. SCSIO 74807]|uniref:hypothetical protein n=1 Tax=Saccharopolyspora sp. SCSIO 74807 TaxID=3118084 RepID=UPI0030D4630A
MTHPSNCQRAGGDTCECQCGGSQHGWPGAISLIRDRSPDALDEFRQRADCRWDAAEDHAAAGKNRSRSTINHKRAAVDTARDHVLRALRDELHATTNSVGEQEKPPHAPAESPSSSAPHDATVDATTREREDNTNRKLATARTDVDRVEAVGELLGQVLAQVEREIGPLGVDTRTAMADHFWCELLVQLVVVIEEAKRAWDAVPQVVGKRLDKVVNASGRKIPTKVVTACTKQLWKRLTEALGLGGIEQAATLLPALRTLAVLLCKSPSRHPAVVQHCLDPLKALLLDKAKQRLKQAFSENLLPEIRAQLG